MKRVYVCLILGLLGLVSSSATENKNKHKLRSRKFDLSFSTETLTGSREKPKLMEHIFSGKPIKVSAKFSTFGDENKETPIKENRNKESLDMGNNFLELKNLEAPTIVKSLGSPAPFNLQDRLANQMEQTITNRQAYDLLYPTHESYYNDKKFLVLDRNFNQVEDYLLNQFKQTIDSAIDYNSNSKLEHVDNFNKNSVNLQGMNLQTNAPFIDPQAVATNMKYDQVNGFNDPNVKVTSSDPYHTIFG